jgi:hypothetical protein
MRLGQQEKQALIAEWRKANADRADVPDERAVLSYAPLIVEEVVKRAATAAYRTTNW